MMINILDIYIIYVNKRISVNILTLSDNLIILLIKIKINSPCKTGGVVIAHFHIIFAAGGAAVIADAFRSKYTRRACAVIFGICSHIFLDMLPHVDYEISFAPEKWTQILLFPCDMLAACFLVYVWYRHRINRVVLWTCVICAVLPDVVQVAKNLAFGEEKLCGLEYFHEHIQSWFFLHTPVIWGWSLDQWAYVSYAAVYIASAAVALWETRNRKKIFFLRTWRLLGYVPALIKNKKLGLR